MDKAVTDVVICVEPPELMRDLVAMGTMRRFPKHSILMTEGDDGHSLYVILEGRVKAYSSDDEGRECVFDTLGPGSLVGEMALDGQPRTASIMTLSPATCVVVPLDALRQRCRTDAEFSFNLILFLIQRSRKVVSFARKLALESAYRRLRGLLDEIVVEQKDGSRIVPEPMSQQEIANRIGTSRDMVSKLFKELVKGGYLSYTKKSVAVLKALPQRW